VPLALAVACACLLAIGNEPGALGAQIRTSLSWRSEALTSLQLGNCDQGALMPLMRDTRPAP
jgi:hypothetical protein